MLLPVSLVMQDTISSTSIDSKSPTAARVDHTAQSPESKFSCPQLTSRSSTSSPTSQKTLLDSAPSQSHHPDGPQQTRDLTPPSSISSSQEHPETCRSSYEESFATGKKRTANGKIKSSVTQGQPGHAHSRTHSTISGSAIVVELSETLKTKLSYAMIKVQNGWQSHTIDEVESLASHSPRSAMSGFNRMDRSLAQSPRVVLAATMHNNNALSSVNSNQDSAIQVPGKLLIHEESSPSKTLAPSASFTSGSRRRAALNGNLHVKTMKPPHSSRPIIQQRTASQNAAMEADAVETLLFMSASPNSSGRYTSAFSPVSQTFSAQTSPSHDQFSPGYRRPYEDRDMVINRLLRDLDTDTSSDLDEAVRILEEHRANNSTP